MLQKAREFFNAGVPRSIYHAIFNYHLNYDNIVWGQNKNSLSRLFSLQKKALRIISFECSNAHRNPLFYRHEIARLYDKIIIANCLFSANPLILIFHQFLITGLPFREALIGTKHLVLHKDS